MNVLIVDDDPDDTTLLCEALMELFPTANCTTSHTCEHIERQVKDAQPDIIFMDGHMYPINGIECLRRLNASIDRTRIKICIHSGSFGPHELEAINKLDVDEVMLKAHSYQELKANLRAMLIDKYQFR